MQKKAVLFDFDGTLVNSEYFHFECWQEVLSEFDITFDWPFYLEHFAGIPTPDSARKVVTWHNLKIDPIKLADRGEQLSASKLGEHEIQLMPYVMDSIHYFRNKEIPLAIVTGSPRDNVEKVLQLSGLGEYFQATVTRTDVTNSKPHPESYHKGVEALGYAHEEYLVFEDTENGVKSAKAADLTCFAVQQNTDEHHKLNQADKIFLDLKEALTHLDQQQII